METNLDATLRAAGENPDYDAACKSALSEKIILAWIMKRCLKEYESCDVNDIAEKYIEGTPEVMKVPVAPDETNQKRHIIEGMNTEDSTITEGVVRYDIRFRATTPKSDKIGLIINVEAQNKSDAKHSLMKRAVYYCARMISSQKKDIFKNSQYDDIVKVYSIWLYMNPTKDRKNSITRYSIKEESLIGNVNEIVENYDLMSVVNICLGDFAAEGIDKTLQMLNYLFTKDLTPQQKKQILEGDFDIPMSLKLESEVVTMGSLSRGIYEEGIEEGIEKGLAQGIEIGLERNRLESIRSVVNKTGWTAEEAMDFLDVPKLEQKKYLDLLKQ